MLDIDGIKKRVSEERAELKEVGFGAWIKNPTNWLVAGLVAGLGFVVLSIIF